MKCESHGVNHNFILPCCDFYYPYNMENIQSETLSSPFNIFCDI